MMASPTRWPTLVPEAAFEDFYHIHVLACTRATRRRYQGMRSGWGISSAAYDALVADAVVDSFMTVRTKWDEPGFEARRPLALLVKIAQMHLLQLLDGTILTLKHRAHPDAVADTPVSDDVLTRTAVHQVLSVLPPREQQAIHGHYVKGRSLSEVACDMDTSEAGIKCLLQRGRSHFKTLWLDEPGGTP